jgi:hypothetical protein
MTSPFAACYNAHGGQAVLAALSTSYATGPRLGGLLFGANETAAEEHPGTPRYARLSVSQNQPYFAVMFLITPTKIMRIAPPTAPPAMSPT